METVLIENTGVEFNVDTGDYHQLATGDELIYTDDNNVTIKLIITGRRWKVEHSGYYGSIVLAKEVK